MSDNETDILLMRKVADGDEAAARELVRKWQKPLINFFYRSVRNVHSAEDLAQQTFVKLCRSAKGYAPTAAFSTYIFHIANNVLISDFRRRSRRNVELCDPAELPAVCDDKNEISSDEIRRGFEDAVQKLPDNHRTAILLLCQQELSYEEIAAAMDTSVANVKTWIHRARLRLRELLGDLLD
ncbi:MAG: RNA polymerase sigma factor [Opitutae bacterium]|nr:RNA polymerase sigma factor [Opitutae bacterium]MCD8298994.1 RNA polymerase sigma factor [Opitutae bacterium]